MPVATLMRLTAPRRRRLAPLAGTSTISRLMSSIRLPYFDVMGQQQADQGRRICATAASTRSSGLDQRSRREAGRVRHNHFLAIPHSNCKYFPFQSFAAGVAAPHTVPTGEQRL
jgi:hypothetical protein